MINEERVKLMTRLALFRQQEEHRSLEVNRSRRRDYLWLNMMKTVICFTLAAAILVVISLLFLLMQPGAWSFQQLFFYGITVLILYAAGLALAVMAAYVISDSRYEKASKRVGEYERMLRRIKWLYEREDRRGTGV